MEVCMGAEQQRPDRRKWDATYLSKHPETRKASSKAYSSKPEVKAKTAVWRRENADRIAASRRKWYEKNKESNSIKAALYARQHPEWKAAHCAKRRARKLRACPDWLTREQVEEINSFYKEAELRKQSSGIVWHVDHIVPLQGKTVCGLHVP